MFLDEQWHAKHLHELGGSISYAEVTGTDGSKQLVQRVKGGKLKDIEHSRSVDARLRPVHIAVAILDDGCCFVGKTVCSLQDSYSHKYGYRRAVGRALKKAVIAEREPGGHTTYADFAVDRELEGRDLFAAVVGELNARGIAP